MESARRGWRKANADGHQRLKKAAFQPGTLTVRRHRSCFSLQTLDGHCARCVVLNLATDLSDYGAKPSDYGESLACVPETLKPRPLTRQLPGHRSTTFLCCKTCQSAVHVHFLATHYRTHSIKTWVPARLLPSTTRSPTYPT